MDKLMKRTVSMLMATLVLAGACMAHADSGAGDIDLPTGYRNWTLISVAREEGNLDDLRAILGNEPAIKALKKSEYSIPNGAIIARFAWSYEALEESAKAFGRPQSHVAGHPKNSVQLMVKDTTRYASTGGWGFAQFDAGKSTNTADQHACFACHSAAKDRDYVFNRFAPDLSTGTHP